jgi:hypothetical protein
MLNTAELEKLVRDQVATSVNNEIIGLLDSANWLNTVEESIIDYAQQRVVAKFSNDESMAQILATVENSVKTLFENGSITSIKDLVSEDDIQSVINSELNNAIGLYIEKLFDDKEWISNVRSHAVAHLLRGLEKELRSINVNQTVLESIEKLFKEHAKTIEFNGIDDQSSVTELTVMNGAVVVEHDFVATDIQAVESIATKTLSVQGDLVVKGNVNTDGRAWDNLKTSIEQKVTQTFESKSKDDLIDSILDRAKNSGITFDQVKVNGKTLVSDNVLSSAITESSLQKVGLLKELTVIGEADFNNTAFVANKRLGVNTREPSSALSVWDEEVEISVGKRKERTGFIGTNRKQHLEIGVNGKGDITIKDDGLVVINQLQVGKQRISHGSEVPGYSGSKGDIVFNINVSPKNPVFAWMCVGGFNWVALSASIS